MEHRDDKTTKFFLFSRPLSTAELVKIIESENFWKDVEKVDLFFTPPVNGGESEEDSGDENEEGDINHLSGRQLQAEAVATVQSITGTINLGEISDEEDNIPLSEIKNKLKMSNIILYGQSLLIFSKMLIHLYLRNNHKLYPLIQCHVLNYFLMMKFVNLKKICSLNMRVIKTITDLTWTSKT